MIQHLAKNAIIYPLHYLRRENIGGYLSEVQAVNSSNRDDIERYQRKCLCDVARTALNSSNSGYALLRKSAQHIADNSIISLMDSIPLQSKETMRAAMKADGRPKGVPADHRSTSGSTGIPFQFYKDRFATGFMDAVLYAAYAWHNIRIGDPQARFWGMPLTPTGATVAQLKDLLKNRIRFSAFDLSDAAKDAYHQNLLSFKPTYFYGYPSLMVEFCKHIINKKADLQMLPLQAVIGTGEYLYQHERDLVEQVTGAPFVNEYGCTEVGIVGFECRHKSLHVMSSNIYLEIIKDGKQVLDEEGDIHVTELHTRSNPFIRYNLGDRGVLCSARCSCGSSLPVMKVLSGRKDDYVMASDGRKVYDAIFAYTLKTGISQFRAVQTAVDRIDISIIPNDEYSPELGERYVRNLKKQLGESFSIKLIMVDTIERERSGKLRYFRNDTKI